MRASSEDELVRKVADHLQRKHNVKHVTGTLQKYALRVARQR